MQLNDYKNIVILGMGKTGLSCAKFLHQKKINFFINDSRENPPELANILKLQIANKVITGGFNRQIILTADLIIVSQGIPLQNPIIVEAFKRNIKIINEVDLFSSQAKAPIVAITGSNAKSTVTTLVGNIIAHAGLKVLVGGNIGVPLLELLLAPAPDYYVIELSNFQLELTHELSAKIACILNLSPDHLDRYASYNDYIAAKHRIYRGAEKIVYNLDDDKTYPEIKTATQTFSLLHKKTEGFCLFETLQGIYLSKSDEPYLLTQNLKVKGRHNWENALAASAIAYELGISLALIVEALQNFSGLLHRCQWVAKKNNVEWFNDSKGTNTGATVAAILGLGPICEGKIILILGGQGKGADFNVLISSITQYVKHIVIFGEDSEKIHRTLSSVVGTTIVSDLKHAVSLSNTLSQSGDMILFSPACASFDMFDNFEHRGEVYMDIVKGLMTHDNGNDI